MRILAALLLGLACISCATTISPRALRESDQLGVQQKQGYLELWNDAILRANSFLASEHNQLMPQGTYQLHDAGMVFETAERSYEVTVMNTTWGDVVVKSGFTAQERSWGFVVGDVGEGPSLTANTLFHRNDGARREPDSLAELLLHETAHQVHEVGTLDLFSSVSYYWYSIYLSHGEHPAELVPNQVSREFYLFAREHP